MLNDTVIGKLYLEYKVTKYNDIKLNNSSIIHSENNRKFYVQCRQRIIIYNKDGFNLSPNAELKSYENYPALLSTFMEINPNEGLSFKIIEYSPQTINTKIESSGTTGSSTGEANSSSRSSTIGSSISQTNSYGASVTVGVSAFPDGILPSASATANYENSTTNSHSNSISSGVDSSHSNSQSQSNNASMSIKDWGAYALVNPKTESPTWNFGQEFPWDAIMCRKTDGETNQYDQERLIIPTDMLVRLYDGKSLFPPSHLAMFGFSFLTKAIWFVTLEDGTASDEMIFKHDIQYALATHSLDNDDDVNVYIDRQPVPLSVAPGESLETKLDLSLMALDPIGLPNNSAIIGFIPNRFLIKPERGSQGSAPIKFKIISSFNNLIIQDITQYPNDTSAGFSASETVLTGSLSQDCTILTIESFFKIIDYDHEYMLHLKHWKSGDANIKLTFTINGDEDNEIVKYVDAKEAEGGENNLMSISLRKLDYSSTNFHDYLKLGLNSIKIKIEQSGQAIDPDSHYQIRAISIEKE